MSRVYLVKTGDRAEGVRRCIDHFGLPDAQGKTVYVKPNFNTADPAPGSTDPATLDALLSAARQAKPARIILGERSGPADVSQVFKAKGADKMCEKYGAEFLNLETLPDDQWTKYTREDLHWQGGIEIPKALSDADIVVGTCCLKTHGFGGVYSNSLKLAVGMTKKDFMKLHTDDIRQKIAEINLTYKPAFIISDAVEVFTDGGPMSGTRVKADLMFIGDDRIALDAVGLAILKSLGSNKAIMDTPIFKQEQIARAVELGLGVSSARDIEIVTDDPESERWADKIRAVLAGE